MFSRADITPFKQPGNLESRLRGAYDALAAEPGAWVALARLRPFFTDVDRAHLDDALIQLSRAVDVDLVPENNQKALTKADWAAAVWVGGENAHLLAIGV
jgi:hypothetical protein